MAARRLPTTGVYKTNLSFWILRAQKFPPSNYLCVVLAVKPADHTRVRKKGDYVEIMPSFLEMEELVVAMNNAALATNFPSIICTFLLALFDEESIESHTRAILKTKT